jgi:hypothetical protein
MRLQRRFAYASIVMFSEKNATKMSKRVKTKASENGERGVTVMARSASSCVVYRTNPHPRLLRSISASETQRHGMFVFVF